MRLSAWQADPPHRDATSSKVMAVLKPLLAALGAEADPECWIAWGDDPRSRYTVLAPSPAGLIIVNVRVNVPPEGPRASAKLVRWNRVQLGELAIETAGGHRLLSFQVEGHVLRGSDDGADAIAGFALLIFAAVDGRTFEPRATATAPRRRAAAPAKPKPAAQQRPARRAATPKGAKA